MKGKKKGAKHRNVVTSKLSSQYESQMSGSVPPLGNKVDLGLIRTETQYRQDSSRPINIQLDNGKTVQTSASMQPSPRDAVREEDGEGSPLVQIQRKADTMFDYQRKQN